MPTARPMSSRHEGMKKLARKLGFTVQTDPEDSTLSLLALERGAS